LALPGVIAIDGEAAAGKSTIGSLLARRLGYLYFDTGVMYRSVTWAAIQQGLDIGDERAVTALAERLVIQVTAPSCCDGRQYTVLADGQDVTWAIRQPEVDANVSVVAAYRGVRRALTAQQRQIAQRQKVVMVGRDIGTVVMRDAPLKIYMRASVEERARRRYLESLARGESISYAEVLASMRRRDQIDSQREYAPLRAAPDAILVDTDGLTIDQVLCQVWKLVQGE
jgi:cytidylate kinase